MAVNTTRFPLRGTQPRSATTRRASAQPQRPSDDEILGLVTAVPRPSPPPGAGMNDDGDEPAGAPAAAQAAGSGAGQSGAQEAPAQPAASNSVAPELAPILNAHPQLRDAWDAAQQFRAVFATPAAAQDAKNQLDELDSMFFSAQPGDQAALAARIHDLSPGAFHALAQAMQAHAARVAAQNAAPSAQPTAPTAPASAPAATLPSATPANLASAPPAQSPPAPAAPAPSSAQPAAQQIAPPAADPRRVAQLAFFHSANSAAVQEVISAIEAQVNHLLPAGVSAATKTRIVGEIYHDLGAALGVNRKPISPRDVDYKRLSDADILNL